MTNVSKYFLSTITVLGVATLMLATGGPSPAPSHAAPRVAKLAAPTLAEYEACDRCFENKCQPCHYAGCWNGGSEYCLDCETNNWCSGNIPNGGGLIRARSGRVLAMQPGWSAEMALPAKHDAMVAQWLAKSPACVKRAK